MTGRIAGTSYFSVVIEYPGIFLAYRGKTDLLKIPSCVSGILSEKNRERPGSGGTMSHQFAGTPAIKTRRNGGDPA